MTDSVDVLLVDDEPSFIGLAAEMLERVDDSLVAQTATSGQEALSAVEAGAVECVVSDYDMPGMNGLELLEAVRAVNAYLPFVLFTGKGSEEIASEAIAAGVTGYVQKESGREQFELLANQIRNAAAQYRAESELRESERRYERILTGLHEATRDLMWAGTKAEIYRAAVETAGDILEVPIVAAYRFDPIDRTLHHAASVDAPAESLDPDRSFDPDSGHVWETFSAGSMRYVPDLRETVDDAASMRRRSEVLVPLGAHGLLVTGSEAVDGFDETTIELIQILAANTEAALDRAEREALLRDHDRRLTRKNEELTRLNRTNELVREITRGVAQATTREEIEATVCERLAGGDRYLAAWILPDTDDPAPSARSGIDDAYLDSIAVEGSDSVEKSDAVEGSDAVDASDTVEVTDTPEVALAARAIEDRSVRVVSDVLDEPTWHDRRTAAITQGFQTVLAVPILARDRDFGAIVVHAKAADAVTDDERQVLAELGETIGFAIRTAERTQAMVTDEHVELELAVSDDNLLFNRLVSELDADVSVVGLVARTDESISCFLRVPNEAVADLLAVVEAESTVDAVTAVAELDDETRYEVTVSSLPLLDACLEYDAQLREITTDGDASTITVRLPRPEDARSFVERVEAVYDGTELVARRSREFDPADVTLAGQVEARLTPKQREAIESAHFSGYFEWPRETTGEDLASALSVSAPTLHYHLRAAQRKLVEVAVEGDSN